MSLGLAHNLIPVLAAESTGAFRALEFDLPETPWQWIVYGGGLLLLFVFTFATYVRDTRNLSRFWKIALMTLRAVVLIAVVTIAVNPQERTQRMAYRPSRVAVLVDSSLSMRYPERDDSAVAGSAEPSAIATRAEASETLLAKSPLIDELRKMHDVSIYTFDSQLTGPHAVFRRENTQGDADASIDPLMNSDKNSSGLDTPDWPEILRPRGLETRLGESLLELIRQVGGRTLSGIVVVSDGGANSGIDPATANAAARSSSTRLVTVGVGSTQPPMNLQLSSIQAPTDVHVGDAFEISAFVQAQGLSGKNVEVQLLGRLDGDESAPALLSKQEVRILEDGIPVEVTFERLPEEAGRMEFFVRVQPTTKIRELSNEDNEGRKTIAFVDEKTKILIIAGGPMRDYRFVRNMLYRHSAVEVDVWLQSADPGGAVSQDADHLLTRFPQSREDFFNYDVVLAFDPDWTQVTPEQMEMLTQWIFRDSGGLILIAGDIYTPMVAGSPERFSQLLELYPVFLSPYLMDLQFESAAQQPWPLNFTRDGQDAGFLQLTDDPGTANTIWEQFPGVYRGYPTSGAKAGATVYVNFSDPRSQTEHGPSILMASQFYGSGRSFFLGSSELWRLRAMDEEYYDRFWTKLIREVGQGRNKRGTNRGMLLLERNQYALGQTVRVRAHLLDREFKELNVDNVTLDVYDPNGRPIIPPPRLRRDRNRAGQYFGDFRAGIPGTWKLEIPIPESQDVLSEKIDVVLPNLETDNARQNAQLLRGLAQDTGGSYLTYDEAAAQLPALLPNRGEEFLVDERLRTLWDRTWLMYGLVGFLTMEWLIRKLLKLA